MSVPAVAKLRRLLDSLPREALPDILTSIIRTSNKEKLQVRRRGTPVTPGGPESEGRPRGRVPEAHRGHGRGWLGRRRDGFSALSAQPSSVPGESEAESSDTGGRLT